MIEQPIFLTNCEATARRTLDGARLLVAYANDSTFVATTREYLESFARHSSATVRYAHVTAGAQIAFELDAFDIVFQSYCARWPVPGYVSDEFRSKLKDFHGVKLIAVQDEYEHTGRLQSAIREIGYHAVFTCVPPDQIARVYPPEMFPDTEFVSVLTGYVPETPELSEIETVPLRDRPIMIGYRGRDLGALYGRLGFDKLEIGRRMREICDARGVRHDIDWTDDSRIYGSAWYEFVGSCRAMLGTESGSNVFDFDSAIEAKYRSMSEEKLAPISYDEFHRYTDEIEAQFDMGQISPRVFEAAALRTPMILHPGRYSGAIRPGEHYIELKKDFSNVDSVLVQLEDVEALGRMAERAHAHLIGSGAFSYKLFVSLVETVAARKAAEIGFGQRMVRPPLPPEPLSDQNDSANMREMPTRRPRDAIHYYYKQQAAENRRLKEYAFNLSAEISRLNAEYGMEREQLNEAISHLNTEVARLNEVYPTEIARLNEVYPAEIARLNEVYPTEIARLNEVYPAEIARLTGIHSGEIARLKEVYTREIACLNEIYPAELAGLRDALARPYTGLARHLFAHIKVLSQGCRRRIGIMG